MREVSEQEVFWRQVFGADYIARNKSEGLLASNIVLFSKILEKKRQPVSVLELGANIGMNVRALKLLFPEQVHAAIEINPQACEELAKVVDEGNLFSGSIFDVEIDRTFDLVFTKGVLIHISPDLLPSVYEKWLNGQISMCS